MIGIIDYGVGNIGSIRNGLEFLKIPHIISHQKKKIYHHVTVLFYQELVHLNLQSKNLKVMI